MRTRRIAKLLLVLFLALSMSMSNVNTAAEAYINYEVDGGGDNGDSLVIGTEETTVKNDVGNSVAIGLRVEVDGESSIAIGSAYESESEEGRDPNGVYSRTHVSGDYSIAIGDGHTATEGDESIAFGAGAVVDGDNDTALGVYSNVKAEGGTAVGHSAKVTAESGTAIGYGAEAEYANSVAIGANSVTYEANTVSVGSAGNERRITNVAAGATSLNSTDAINGGQIYSLGSSIASALGSNWKFDADTGTLSGYVSITAGDGSTLTFSSVSEALTYLAQGWDLVVDSSGSTGEDSGEQSGTTGGDAESGTSSGSSTVLPGDSVTVAAGNNIEISNPTTTEGEYSSDHKITVSVSDNPVFETVKAENVTVNKELTVADTVTINENGISVGDKITINKDDGIDMGGLNITNVGNFKAETIESTTIESTTVNVTESLTVADVVTINNTGITTNTINIGNIYSDGTNIDMGGGTITNLSDGGIYAGSTDAVTGNQLWQAYQRMDNLQERINVVGAHAAALSGLHPIQ